ncbi:MAG TPA: type II secretion system protein [Rhodocyclaceae bacterium]|nr:type II secretion system protein [Rhodocyclaceae bacterium]
MRPATDRFAQAGVTLVEMIVSIVIAGILIALVGMFGRWQIQSYFDISNRAALADAGDTALRRIARELQSALPNSVRVNTVIDDGSSGDGLLLEYVPIVDAGRYRADYTLSGTGNPLDFLSPTDTSFDVLGPGVSIANGQSLVIYNLGQPGSNVYEGTSRRLPSVSGTALTSVSFASPQFPLDSPAHRFQVVGQPVTFACDRAGSRLLRYTNYGFSQNQAASAAAFTVTPSVLVDHVQDCQFIYTPGALQRNGLVSIFLTLMENGEKVDLLHQVEVLNTP